MKVVLNPASPIPLYHQIVETLRRRIATGKLPAGTGLPPVREAAAAWGVNMHTVRRAYRTLAGDGLVEIDGARGTRVASGHVPAAAGESPALGRFVERTVHEARRRHGLTHHDLAHLLANWTGAPTGEPAGTVSVVECSEAQCASLAREIETAWSVRARPWRLSRKQAPPAGPVVATTFHLNEVRRRWPHRRADIRFVATHPDPALPQRLGESPPAGGRTAIALCDSDTARAVNTAVELSVIFPADRYVIQPCGVPEGREALASSRGPVLFTARAWEELAPAEQAHPHAEAVLYVIEKEAMEELGRRFRWRRGPSRLPLSARSDAGNR